MSLSRPRLAGILVSAVLLVVVGTALFLLGSPAAERARRLDERRVEALERLARGVDLYWTRHAALPMSTQQVQQEQGVGTEILDPATNALYEYRALEGQAFELCAQFEADSDASERWQWNGFWSHRAGRQCFRRDAKKVD